MKKKTLVKIIGCVAVVSMLAGSVHSAAYAKPESEAAENSSIEVTEETADAVDSFELDPIDITVKAGDCGKEESVYVFTDETGKVDNIIVSEWLKNPGKNNDLKDVTSLTDIENTKGEETYTLGNGDEKIWNAKGEDIYYQGNSNEALPVNMKIRYTLDGKEVSAQELLGKSGHLVIRFDYENTLYTEVEVDGEMKKMQVPFVALTGMLLDDEVFRNVEVVNGKLINDGNYMAVIGMALPGLQDSLNVSKENLILPDYIEVSADVTDFSMSSTMTLVSNEVFKDITLDNLDTTQINDMLDELTDAMDQLKDGSEQLYDGLCELNDKTGDLKDGVKKIADGAKQVKGGVGQLKDGAGKIKDGAAQLSSGLNKLNENSAALNAGAKQVFDTLLAEADKQLAAAGLQLPKLTVENYKTVIDNAIAAVKNTPVEEAAKKQVEQQVRANTDLIRAQVTQAVLAANGLTEETYEAGLAAGLVTEEQKQAIEAAIAQNTEATIQAKIAEVMAGSDVQQQIAQGKAQIDQAVKQLNGLKAQLDSYKQFYDGLKAYTGGVAQAATGAGELYKGACDLYNGVDTLYNGCDELAKGTDTLNSKMPTLADGVLKLKEGAGALHDGLVEFDEKAIQKITDSLEGDLGGLSDNFDALVKAADTYQSYAGKSDDVKGKVKFIYRSAGIE